MPGDHPPSRTSIRLTPRKTSLTVLFISYADDVNPLIISENYTVGEHRSAVAKVDQILEEEAKADNLTWYPDKQSLVEFSNHNDSTTTLGITINSKLNWAPHIQTRTKKALKVLGVMKRLGNSRGG